MKHNQDILQDRILKWGNETAECYHQLAVSLGINKVPAFYTQSDLSRLTQCPSLIIAGINPGSVGTYAEQLKNANWQLGAMKRMDGAHLIKGNYCIVKEGTATTAWDEHTQWHYWNGLKRYLSQTEYRDVLADETRFVLTNASFFTTPKANELSEDLLVKTIPCTLKLMELLHPKLILFLSGKKCFQRLEKIKDKVNISFRYVEVVPNVYLGELNHTVCLGVPHPTYRSRAEMELITTAIALLYKDNIDAVDVSAVKEQCKQLLDSSLHSPTFDYRQILALILSDSRFHFSPYHEKQYRYVLNKDLILSLSPANHGNIAIRHKGYREKYSQVSENYPRQVFYQTVLSQYHYNINQEVWLGIKSLKSFGFTTQQIIDNFFEELAKLLENLR